MNNITLTSQQQAAAKAVFSFLADPNEPAFVLAGYSGTGKSTLVEYILEQLPLHDKAMELLDPDYKPMLIQLTATTNKAAENLAFITKQDVITIHSFLGLRLETDYRTGKTRLIPSGKQLPDGYVVFIDEASYVDAPLLEQIFNLTSNCKIVFIGDPAQLTPINSNKAPVFAAGFPTAELTQVVRQAEGNPIIDLATKFRHTVNTGEFFSFVPDGQIVKHVDRNAFNAEMLADFQQAGWSFRDSKMMGWTNKCVIGYNHAVNDAVKGTPQLQEGDYAICNNYLQVGRKSIKTDQTVLITHISPVVDQNDVSGNLVELNRVVQVFLPHSRDASQARLKKAKVEKDFGLVRKIESEWADLRAAYASTINKAQGSTYDRVYIDLDDIKGCRSANQIARMLYVGVSRARHSVTLTGDLV